MLSQLIVVGKMEEETFKGTSFLHLVHDTFVQPLHDKLKQTEFMISKEMFQNIS